MGVHKKDSGNCKMHTTIIINLIDQQLGIPKDILLSKTRMREVVSARAMCYFILRKHHDYAFAAIGKQFNGKDHATILHGVNTHNDLYITNWQGYKATFDKLDEAYILKIKGDDVEDDHFLSMIRKIESIEKDLAIVKRGLITSYAEGSPVDPILEEKINKISTKDETDGENDERAVLEKSIADGIRIGTAG